MRIFLPVVLGLVLVSVWAPAQAETNLSVEVSGIEGQLRTNVLSYLSIHRRRSDTGLTGAKIRRWHRRAPGQIRRALRPLGYYQPSVEEELKRTQSGWVARYEVDHGIPVRVDELDLKILGEGSDDPKLTGLLDNFPLARGDVLHHGLYERAKQELRQRARRRGYFEARFVASRVDVNTQLYRARIRLHFHTGPRYRFGEVTFEGAELDESLLRGYVDLKPGEPYRSERILDQQEALLDSGYFRNVDVQPLTERDRNQRVPVHISLTPAKKHRFELGVGFGTNTGPRLRGGYRWRRINPQGHRFTADFEVSRVRSEARARYSVPLSNPRTDELAFAGSLSRDEPDPYTSDLQLLDVEHTRKWGKWTETQSLQYRREDFTVSDQTGDSGLVIPGWNWHRTRAEDPFYPTWGHSIQVSLRGTHEDVLSDATFLQTRLEGRWIESLNDTVRVLVRGNVGATLVDRVRELPPTIRFFTGGDRSVRGYEFKSLGPRDARQKVIGGRHLLVGSVEFEHRFMENWAAAVFYDAGNAVNDFEGSIDLKQGAGFGIRWLSPVGPVRLDLGFALDRAGNPARIHFTVGPDL